MQRTYIKAGLYDACDNFVTELDIPVLLDGEGNYHTDPTQPDSLHYEGKDYALCLDSVTDYKAA